MPATKAAAVLHQIHLQRARPDDFDARARYRDEVSASGVFGGATAASAAKGERILAAVEQRIVDLILELRREIVP